MFKFIHIADVHLDTHFYSRDPELRNKLRDSLREAFNRVIDTCIDEKVQGLLIAGDLFDNDKLSFQTEVFLINAFTRLKENNIKVYYATGNHDPGDKNYRANLINWPDNVHLFNDDSVQELEVKHNHQIVAKIVSVGHKSKKEARNLIKDLPAKNTEIPVVGLAHAMVTTASGVDGHDSYLPCTAEDLISKHYNYWALGHIHQAQQVANESIYYCGNLQGRNPKETGEKGGYIVTIDDYGNVEVKFRRFSNIQWNTLEISEMESIKNYQELKDYIIVKIEAFLNSKEFDANQLILRLQLEGRCFLKKSMEIDEDIKQLEEDIKLHLNLLSLEIKANNLLPLVNSRECLEGNHVLSRTVDLILNIKDNQELIDKLLEIKLCNKKLDGKNARLKYILELVEGLEEEALNRMVGEEK
ncbi:DNA repair exonuclease [Alkaliphilus pronyensis]|uniref:DNA repair exonuclease n=1 Tax=Alkaliphilus pronyensis TaxID=1482732 RepID=A0A6I0EY53_9FIRM|nr:DNA repair exonuclease [Alkaliphilus pronyensis]KAB3534390.1 DNA repair exonuclease [Alkaliphilus pronyensis]